MFRNVFSVGFLGLAHKMVQLSRASLKNCHVSSQDDRTTGAQCLTIKERQCPIYISMHKLKLVC